MDLLPLPSVTFSKASCLTDVLHICLSICVWSALCWWSFSKRVAFWWASIVYFFWHPWASTAPRDSPAAILSGELPPQSRCLCWLPWAPCLLTQQLNPNSPVSFPGLLQIQNHDLWATCPEQLEAKQWKGLCNLGGVLELWGLIFY